MHLLSCRTRAPENGRCKHPPQRIEFRRGQCGGRGSGSGSGGKPAKAAATGATGAAGTAGTAGAAATAGPCQRRSALTAARTQAPKQANGGAPGGPVYGENYKGWSALITSRCANAAHARRFSNLANSTAGFSAFLAGPQAVWRPAGALMPAPPSICAAPSTDWTVQTACATAQCSSSTRGSAP